MRGFRSWGWMDFGTSIPGVFCLCQYSGVQDEGSFSFSSECRVHHQAQWAIAECVKFTFLDLHLFSAALTT